MLSELTGMMRRARRIYVRLAHGMPVIYETDSSPLKNLISTLSIYEEATSTILIARGMIFPNGPASHERIYHFWARLRLPYLHTIHIS